MGYQDVADLGNRTLLDVGGCGISGNTSAGNSNKGRLRPLTQGSLHCATYPQASGKHCL